MRDKHEELIEQLHELADWVEKHNSVHCHSVPRKAAYTIARLEEENYRMHLQLNKKYLSFRDRYDMFIGAIRLRIYLMRKKWKKG
jgi:iron-sulfur cluster repair protein YtfE (RIC family)